MTRKLLKISFLICAITLFCGCGNTKYAKIGLSSHTVALDAPEVDFGPDGDLLGHVELGLRHDTGLSVWIRHTSAIFVNENGGGLNEFGVSYEISSD